MHGPAINDQRPRLTARVAGLLYLVITIAAPFGELYVRGSLVVKRDAAATAANIRAHESLYRLGGCADLLAFACDVAVALLLYELLKPASRSVSLQAAFFRLMHAAVVAVATVAFFAPLVLLGGAPYMNAFGPGQLEALASASLRLHGQGYTIALVFFGVHCVLVGYLIFRSTFLPAILGPLMAAAGLCYLVNSFAALLAPAFHAQIYPLILMPAAVAELSLMVWLIAVGVNVPKWREQIVAHRVQPTEDNL